MDNDAVDNNWSFKDIVQKCVTENLDAFNENLPPDMKSSTTANRRTQQLWAGNALLDPYGVSMRYVRTKSEKTSDYKHILVVHVTRNITHSHSYNNNDVDFRTNVLKRKTKNY